MKLFIDTTKGINVRLIDGEDDLAQRQSEKKGNQSDQLLVLIDEMLSEISQTIDDVKLIEVETRGDSFTSLRVGVVTANALAFALGIPVKAVNGQPQVMVAPEYSREPEIGGVSCSNVD